jgi:hypothetical protein
MNNELEGCGRKQSWPNFWYNSGIFLEGLRKTMKNFREDNRYPGRDSNRSHPEFKSEALPLKVVCSVISVIIPIIIGEGTNSKAPH